MVQYNQNLKHRVREPDCHCEGSTEFLFCILMPSSYSCSHYYCIDSSLATYQQLHHCCQTTTNTPHRSARSSPSQLWWVQLQQLQRVIAPARQNCHRVWSCLCGVVFSRAELGSMFGHSGTGPSLKLAWISVLVPNSALGISVWSVSVAERRKEVEACSMRKNDEKTFDP